VRLFASPVGGTLTLAGPIVAGYGTVAGVSPTLQGRGRQCRPQPATAGKLAVNGSAGGGQYVSDDRHQDPFRNRPIVELNSTGAGLRDRYRSRHWPAPGSARLSAAHRGRVPPGRRSGCRRRVTIGAIGGVVLDNNAIIASTGAGGVSFTSALGSATLVTLNSGTIAAAGNGDVAFGDLRQTVGGSISANRNLLVSSSITQDSARRSRSAAPPRSAPALAARGTATRWRRAPATSTLNGTLLAAGNIDIWAGGTLALGGTIAGNGHVWATASGASTRPPEQSPPPVPPLLVAASCCWQMAAMRCRLLVPGWPRRPSAGRRPP